MIDTPEIKFPQSYQIIVKAHHSIILTAQGP